MEGRGIARRWVEDVVLERALENVPDMKLSRVAAHYLLALILLASSLAVRHSGSVFSGGVLLFDQMPPWPASRTRTKASRSTPNQICILDVASKVEIAAEQEGTICTVEVCKEFEERDEDNILNKVCQGDTSDGQGTTEEKLFDGFCKSEIPEYEVAEMVVNILEDNCKEENSADIDIRKACSQMEQKEAIDIDFRWVFRFL